MKQVIIIGGSGIHNSNSAASARMWNYAKSISANGDVDVYLASMYEDNISSPFRESNFHHIHVLECKAHPKTESIYSQWKFLNSLKQSIDNINDASFIVYPQVNCQFETLFLLWAKFNGISNIYCEINEVRRYWSSLEKFTYIKRLAYLTVFNISERYSALYKGLICINKNIKRYYSKYNSNILIVPILSPTQPIVLKDSYDLKSQITITFTGTIDVEKENLKELIHGLYLFSNETRTDWNLKMYGFLNNNNKERIESIAKTYNLNNRIKFMGQIPHSDVAKILKQSDCLVLPRENNLQNFYGFSTKLSEYLVSGTPVILTRTGVVEEYLTDGIDCKAWRQEYKAIGHIVLDKL